jgi:hypothetical protein
MYIGALDTPREDVKCFSREGVKRLMDRRVVPSLEAAVSRLREISRKVDELLPEANGETRAKLAEIKTQSEEAASYYDVFVKRPSVEKPKPRKLPQVTARVGLAAFGAPLVGMVPKQFSTPKRAA